MSKDADIISECSSSSESESNGSYSTSLHWFGCLSILLVSLLAVTFSLILGSKSKTSIFISKFLQVLKMFGIGVIAGTAWCHLIPEAIEQFSSPCLEGVIWTGYGSHWMGVFALFSSFLVQQIELSGSHRHSDHHHHHHHDHHHHHHHDHHQSHHHDQDTDSEEIVSISLPEASYTPKDHNHLHIIECKSVLRKPSSLSASSKDMTPHSKLKRLQTIILEVGILTHSLIIGLTLGLTPDSLFPTLLLAISFHQFFEGLALGILVAEINFSSLWKQIQMVGLYPIVTPLGIAIGIFLQSKNSNGASSASLILLQAIFGSLSSGILIYNTYCELFAGEISLSAYFAVEVRGWFRVLNFMALYLGAASMALLAFWA